MLNKKKLTQQVTDRGSNKLRKIEGNVKITSNRLTIPPGYLTLGISSETFRKDTGKDTNSKRNEDLQGLLSKCFNVGSLNLRRSKRISKKNCTHDEKNSFPFVPDFPPKLFDSSGHVEIERTPAKRDKSIWRNRSKSLFKEINEKYVAKTAPYFNNFNILTPPQENTSFYSSPDDDFLDNYVNFSENLSKQVHNYPTQKVFTDCRSRILMKIKNINSILAGETQTKPKMGANVQFSSTGFLNDAETNFQYYPKSQWVYETPPRQKLILPRLEECQIHPAVIYSTKKDTNIYEISHNINIDLSTYASGRKIDFDKRFLSHVSTLNKAKVIDRDNNCLRKTNPNLHDVVEDQEISSFSTENPTSTEYYKPVFNFTKPNPFIGLISRPRKTEKVSRLKTALKRKLDNNEYEESLQLMNSNSQSKDIFGHSFSSEADLQHANFEFKKKLFCDTEIDKGTEIDKPNLFDFSQ